jgi:hypothetical protein
LSSAGTSFRCVWVELLFALNSIQYVHSSSGRPPKSLEPIKFTRNVAVTFPLVAVSICPSTAVTFVGGAGRSATLNLNGSVHMRFATRPSSLSALIRNQTSAPALKNSLSVNEASIAVNVAAEALM